MSHKSSGRKGLLKELKGFVYFICKRHLVEKDYLKYYLFTGY